MSHEIVKALTMKLWEEKQLCEGLLDGLEKYMYTLSPGIQWFCLTGVCRCYSRHLSSQTLSPNFVEMIVSLWAKSAKIIVVSEGK